MNPGAVSQRPGLTLRLTNDLKTIAFARMIVRHVLPTLGETQEPLYFGALTEVLNNAIEEHLRRGSIESVEVRVATGPNPTITISDFGSGFDPQAESAHSEDTGLGLLISRAIVSGIEIESGPAGTTVTLPYPYHES